MSTIQAIYFNPVQAWKSVSETHSIHDTAVSVVSCQAVVLAWQLQHHVCCCSCSQDQPSRSPGHTARCSIACKHGLTATSKLLKASALQQHHFAFGIQTLMPPWLLLAWHLQ